MRHSMVLYLLGALCAASFAVMVWAAHAGEGSQADPSGPLMRALMAWASVQTGLPVPERLPGVERRDRCAIQALANPESECRSEGGAVAIYDHRSQTVTLPVSWSATRLYDVSVLLHELVHHMQAVAGVTVETAACRGRDVEQPAYEAQMAFIEAAGVDPFAMMRIDALTLMLITACGDPR